jgi:GntR family transcriptional regulator, transcriptional repressor for pyruvate dehydrogenase complex
MNGRTKYLCFLDEFTGTGINNIIISTGGTVSSIRKRKLGDYVIEEIKRRIASGELKEGDKLPNQNEYAAIIGVSRTALRDALQTLTMMGIIEQHPGTGTVIRSANLDLWNEQMTPPLVSDSEATLELITARRFIEAGTAELAVTNATTEDVRKMGELIKHMKTALKEGRVHDYTKLDVQFHHLIAVASHNRYMIHMFITIRKLMEQFILETFTVLPGLLERSLAFHIGIHSGFLKRDAKVVTKNLKDHIQDIKNALETYYQTSLK